MEEVIIEVSKVKLLLGNFCGVFDEKRRREAVFEVCEHEGGKAGGRDLMVEERLVKVETPFCEVDSVLE